MSSLFEDRHPLDAFFAPRSVAVFGANEGPGDAGCRVLENLRAHPFGGRVYPIHARRRTLLGLTAHRHLADVPEPVDLAVIATPAAAVPDVIAECVEANVPGALLLSGGFRETGLEEKILAHARRGRLRIIGPGSLGVMSPGIGLNATCLGASARPGTVAFLSQSGALAAAVLDWSVRENVGFSGFASVGGMLDVGWGDLIEYFGRQSGTTAIVMYMESVGQARAFISAAREVALAKPIIVLKVGRTAPTRAMAPIGDDEVLDAAFRRCGVLRVTTIAELFYLAEVLAKQPRPRGPRLAILTNAGGPALLATDALLAEGGELATFSSETLEALAELLPSVRSWGNPVDILSDADPERYARALDVLLHDPQTDGVLVILTPQALTNATRTAERVKDIAASVRKPVLASWMGGDAVAEGEVLLNRGRIPTFPYPDTAARIFTAMWRYSTTLRSLYETPQLPSETDSSYDRATAHEIITAARSVGRTRLSEDESKRVLSAYGIPTAATRIAHAEEEAVHLADEIGYPVVLKLHSYTITQKASVGGVHLNVGDAQAVRRAYRAIESAVTTTVGAEHFQGVTVQPMISWVGYDLLLGSYLDPQFGPVLVFGSGGSSGEIYRDRALGLPPLTTTLARRVMEQTRIYRALTASNGRASVDVRELERLFVRFSFLVAEQRWIREIAINPLRATSEGFLALDAFIGLHDLDVNEADLPPLAIRPYPTQYVGVWTMTDGRSVTIRPIRPEDEPLMVAFHHTLSDRSVYLRYFHLLKLDHRIAHERLARICFIDYDREMALVADSRNPATGEHEILGVGRLTKIPGTNDAEFALVVADHMQGRGLGTELLRRLLQVAAQENLGRVTGDILPENLPMQQVCRKLGFRLRYSAEHGIVKAEYDFGSPIISPEVISSEGGIADERTHVRAQPEPSKG